MNSTIISKIREEVALTSITISELYYRASKSEKTEDHNRDIGELLKFVGVLQTDLQSAKIFGEKKASLEKKGERGREIPTFFLKAKDKKL